MQALLVIASTFFDICLLRKGPQDLPGARQPGAREFLFICLLANVAANALLLLPEQPFVTALLVSLFNLLLLLLCMAGLLRLRALSARWMQSCTALAGTGTLLGLMGVPLFYWLDATGPGAQPDPTFSLSLWAAFLLLLLTAWSIVVTAHIFRQALTLSFPLAFILVVLLFSFMMAISSMLFPSILSP